MFSHLNLKPTEIRVRNKVKKNENSSLSLLKAVEVNMANSVGRPTNRTYQRKADLPKKSQ